MTTWGKIPPTEPGWYWLRDSGYCLCLTARFEAGRWTLPGTAYPYKNLAEDGYEFGPRISSPDAIEAAKDALLEALPHLPDSAVDRCRAALEGLEARP